jgi:hypothetical protein
VRFRLRIDVANVAAERLLLFLETLDALDQRLELVVGETVSRLFLDSSSGRHRVASLAMTG